MKREIHFVVFQKQSPYLDDMNSLFHLIDQMGIIFTGKKLKRLKSFKSNATKCDTFADVYKSHAGGKETVVVEVNDIYGMLALLGFGIGLALITFAAETVLLVSKILSY